MAPMIGAIAGDIIGSMHEAVGTKTTRFELFTDDSCFTDDTVLSVAVAEVLLTGGDYRKTFQSYFHRYPDHGYGQSFRDWAEGYARKPYGSWGNGSAMRVSPIGWRFDTLEETLAEAERSAAVTHNHPEGIKGAQATAGCIFLARTGHDKAAIREFVETRFGYSLEHSIREMRSSFGFDVSCQGTVPPAIRCVWEANNYEEAVRLAVSLGGDADTLACIAGGIAEALFGGVPASIMEEAWRRLDEPLRDVVAQFLDLIGKKTPTPC